MTADFVGNDRAVVEHQQRLHHQRPTEHMHFRPHRLLDPWLALLGQRQSHQAAVFRRRAAELLHVSIMTEANYRKHHALTEGLARPRGRAMKLTYFEVMAKGLG